MHAERDIVVPILSDCPSNAGTVYKQMDIVTIFDSLVGTSFQFFEPYRRYKNVKKTPSAEALNLVKGKVCHTPTGA